MAISDTPHPVAHLARIGAVLLLIATATVACRSNENRLPGEDSPAATIVNLDQLRAMVVDPPIPTHYLAYVGTKGTYHHFVLQHGDSARRVLMPTSYLTIPDAIAINSTDRRYVLTDGDTLRLIDPDDLF